MRAVSLASGSKGNCLLVESGTTRLLFDNGLSVKALLRRLESVGMTREQIGAVVVSHEHSDHIAGVPLLSQRWKLPVHITETTLAAAEAGTGRRRPAASGASANGLKAIAVGQIRPFEAGARFVMDGLEVTAFSIPHDGADTVGFTVTDGRHKIGLLSDLGMVTTVVRSHLAGCDALFLEFNHDLKTLDAGPYPWPIKQRIKGRHGHLSNEQSAALLAELVHPGLKRVILTHLSEINNRPEWAMAAARKALESQGTPESGMLEIAPQHEAGRWIDLG